MQITLDSFRKNDITFVICVSVNSSSTAFPREFSSYGRSSRSSVSALRSIYLRVINRSIRNHALHQADQFLRITGTAGMGCDLNQTRF
jgi:hypothetical protein